MSVVSGVFSGNSMYLSQKAQEDLQKQQTTFQKTGQKMQTQDLQAAKKAANSLLDTTAFSGLGRNRALTTAANALGSTLQSGSLTGAENAAREIRKEVDSSRSQAKPGKPDAQPVALNASSSSLPQAKASAPPESAAPKGSNQNLDVMA